MDAGGARLLTVGERLEQIGELGVAVLLHELRHAVRPRGPHGSQTIPSVGPRMSDRVSAPSRGMGLARRARRSQDARHALVADLVALGPHGLGDRPQGPRDLMTSPPARRGRQGARGLPGRAGGSGQALSQRDYCDSVPTVLRQRSDRRAAQPARDDRCQPRTNAGFLHFCHCRLVPLR